MGGKIAVVTWYRNGNYGGTLQAFALQEVLKMMGYQSELVNFCPETTGVAYVTKRLLMNAAIFLYKPKFYLSRLQIFRFVRENLSVSNPFYDYDLLIRFARDNYSAAICGSDQIWSNVGGRIEPLNYLTFMEPARRIAYAPSTGCNRIPDSIRSTFSEYVRGMEFLSVREEQGAEFVRSVTGKDARVVLDPTMLLSGSQWDSYLGRAAVSLPREPYIFCYFLGRNPEYLEFAQRVSRTTGYRLVAVEAKHLRLPGVQKVIVDPLQFLAYVRNASHVLTDSFHGVAFSITFGKSFGVFRRFRDGDPINQNDRIVNILRKCGLESRWVSSDTPVSLLTEDAIHYQSVHERLADERSHSLEYLANAVGSVIPTTAS